MASISPTSRPGYVYDSATDTWIPIGIGPHTHQATDLSGVVDDALIDAKGDLIVGSAADTPARLAVGNDGETLVADSSATTGLRWQPSQAAGRNAIINGGMDIWQRGTSFTTNYAYTADRWVAGADAGTFTASRSTDVPSTFTYSLSMAGTNTTSAQIYQIIESQNSTHMAGQTVTLTVYAKSTVGSSGLAWVTQIPGATDNWSSASTDQSGTFTASVSGSWTRYSATFTVGANATRGYKIIIYRNVSATSSTTLYTGIQLELGSVATTFTRAGGTLAGELAACQRYYEKSYELTTAPGTATETGMSILQLTSAATGNIRFSTPFKVTKRTSPTISLYDGAGNINKVMYDFTNNKTGFAVPSQTNVDVYSDNTTNKFEMGFQWTASAEL